MEVGHPHRQRRVISGLLRVNPWKTARHQHRAMEALREGMNRAGDAAQVSDNLYGLEYFNFAATWGVVPVSPRCSRPWLCMEAGYINGNSGEYIADRLRFISAGWNGRHGAAAAIGPVPPDRWDALGLALDPWVEREGYVLLCDQMPNDRAAGPAGWWLKAKYHYLDCGHEVRYRSHPNVMASNESLAAALAGAQICVTWSSTAAVQAVIAGVPTVTLSAESIAGPVTSHRVDAPLYRGDRRPWAYNLAYRQWTLDELRDGTAWKHIRNGMT